MSGGDDPAHITPTTNYNSDDSSSSSKSIFNRATIPIISSPRIHIKPIPTLSEQISYITEPMNNEQSFKSKSQVRVLEEKLNNQQHEITNLHKVIYDLYNQLNHSKSLVNPVSQSPILLSRPNSVRHYTHNYDIQQHADFYSSVSPTCIQRPYETRTTVAIPTMSSHPTDTLTDTNQFYSLQETLNKTNTALERLGTEINYLRQEHDERRHCRSNSGINSSNSSTPSTHISPPPSQNSHPSAFKPIVAAPKIQSIIPSTNTFTSPPLMPFTMSLSNSLPSFSGKENEMPSKFLTEFEIRASGLFGHNDDYLIRAVQQTLSDSALTWFIQAQQEQCINNWKQFKQLFLRRFRTPEKIELFRGKLRTLWQSEHESTVDYFERLKALISEIEPEPSADYTKRKFLQKLRKDIRDKMTVGLTSSLSELVQKAIYIESNIVQQKIDDKLREAHKEDNIIKLKSTTINNLSNTSRHSTSSLTHYNEPTSHDNKYSRTFTNSTISPSQATQHYNESHPSRTNFNRNSSVNRRNNNNNNNHRWCSFCSSTSHTWFRCYSNPNGPNYQLSSSQRVQPQQHDQQLRQQPTVPSSTSQQQNFNRPHHYETPSQNEFMNQQSPSSYPQPSSSSYFTSQQHSMTKNAQGSRF